MSIATSNSEKLSPNNHVSEKHNGLLTGVKVLALVSFILLGLTGAAGLFVTKELTSQLDSINDHAIGPTMIVHEIMLSLEELSQNALRGDSSSALDTNQDRKKHQSKIDRLLKRVMLNSADQEFNKYLMQWGEDWKLLQANIVGEKIYLDSSYIEIKMLIKKLSYVNSFIRADLEEKILVSKQKSIKIIYFLYVVLILGIATTIVFSTFILSRIRKILDEIKMATREKIEANKKITAMTESFSGGIVAINYRQEIVFWSGTAETIFGWTAAEMIGRDLRKIIPERFLTKHQAGFTQALEGRYSNIKSMEGFARTKDGAEIPIEVSLTYYTLDEDIYFTAYVVDISEKLAVRSQLENQTKTVMNSERLASIGVLAAGVGHEINNPLAISVGNIGILEKVLRRENIKSDKAFSLINKVKESNERVRIIVDGLRTYARADTEHEEEIHLQSVIDSTYGLVYEIYESEGVKIKTDLPKQALYAIGSIGRFQQVLMNLISNAKDATENRKNPSIVVSLKETKNNTVTLAVCDNGMGVAEEHKDKILAPFFTTKEAGKGTGMGLGLVSEFATKMKAHVTFETVIGKGTTFFFTMPQHIKDTTLASEFEEITASRRILPGSSALVIDDEPGIREILVEYLEDFGLTVDEAEDGLAGLDMVRQKKYDYICTDMKMPKMAGEEFIRAARKLPNGQTKYFIITGGVTTNYTKETRVDLYSLGDGYIGKPFTEEKIFSTLSGQKLKKSA